MRTLIFSTIIGLLFSCSSKETQNDLETIISWEFKKLDTIVSFSGCWLSEDYYNNIKEFNSPKNAQKGSQFIFIPERTLQQTIMIYNFHEGGSFLKFLKHGDNFEAWEVQEDSLTQRLYPVEIISSTKIIIDNRTFIKINPLKNQNNYQILEEVLFKSQFTNANGDNIEFKNNGQIIGLDNFKFYDPIIDYYDAGMQVDQIRLGSSPKEMDWYGFKFNKDTLQLFKLNCLTFDSTKNSCVEVEFGDLFYKLWRK